MAARIIVALDSFKGSITASKAVRAFATGWLEVRPEDKVEQFPFADGGEGTMQCFHRIFPGSKIEYSQVSNSEEEIAWLSLSKNVAVLELAAICGIGFTGTDNPLDASTSRLGRAIRDVVERGYSEIIVALGGSGSTDAGAGVLREIGVKILDSNGDLVPYGNLGLSQVSEIDWTRSIIPKDLKISILTDVTNPLFGESGAAYVFGPQKGASPSQVEIMDKNLRHFANFVTGVDPQTPGAGAAGGTAFSLLALGGYIRPGAKAIAELIGLPEAIDSADLLVVGEGKYDSQSLGGKAVGVLSDLAKSASTPVWLVAGVIEDPSKRFPVSASLSELMSSSEAALARPEESLILAGKKLSEKFGTI